ncbi:hypothetical protein [Billgrantia lactosivorans]|uniref:hypothetical protein n=1 Tax=Billgrantia lactosivorans TaxID=2185141 RepID=UPI0013A68D60|nr:hypothetical protein [Halomonas lactosivorans]
MPMNLGVVYLALGRPYLAMALLSAKSLVEKNITLPYTIVTNVCKEPPAVDFFRHGYDRWTYVSVEDSVNRSLKTRILEYSEYQKTIFLDCDTVVMGNLAAADSILDYFDIGIRLNRYPQKRKGKGDIPVLGGLTVGDLPHWNSGVMLIKNSLASCEFFRMWNENFTRLGSQYDQVSLVPTIFKSDARVLSLEERWNATDPGIGRKQWRRDTLVYHYATNICDHLYSTIMRYDQIIPIDMDKHTTRDFLTRKRRLKKSQMNVLRFFAINVSWRFSSPIKIQYK